MHANMFLSARMHPFPLLLVAFLLLGLVYAASTQDTRPVKDYSMPFGAINTTLTPVTGSGSHSGTYALSKLLKGVKITKMTIIATIKAKIVCRASGEEVRELYKSLIQEFGLKTLSQFGLSCLLEALSMEDTYQSEALDVFNELKERGLIDKIVLKSIIFSNACTSESTDLVPVLCPHVTVEDRLRVLPKCHIASLVRCQIVESVTDMELARAIKFAAISGNNKLFNQLLNTVKGDKHILNEALTLLKQARNVDRFVEILEASVATEIT